MKYTVIYEVFASTHVTLEAETAEEALKASEKLVDATICHYCTKSVEIGDIGDVKVVLDEHGNEICNPAEEAHLDELRELRNLHELLRSVPMRMGPGCLVLVSEPLETWAKWFNRRSAAIGGK